jgi:hypothetical protein
LQHLRERVQEGLDDIEQGDVVAFDADEIIRRGEERLKVRQTSE